MPQRNWLAGPELGTVPGPPSQECPERFSLEVTIAASELHERIL